MQWPWARYRHAIEAVAQEIADAEEQKRAAQDRRQLANRQLARSRTISSALRSEIERNGWTELLREAWGSR